MNTFKMGNVTLTKTSPTTYASDFWAQFQAPTADETNRYRSSAASKRDDTEKKFKRRMRMQ